MSANLVLAALVAGVVAALVVTTVGAARRAPLPAWLLAIPPALWAVALGVIIAGVTRGRALMATTDLVGGAPDTSTRLATGIIAQTDLLQWLALAMTWMPILYGTAAVVLVAVRGARAQRPIAPGILVAVAGALPMSVAGVALGAWSLRVATVWGTLTEVAPEDKPRLVAGAFTAAAGDLAHGRHVLEIAIVLAAALAIGAAVLAARRGAIASPRLGLVAAASFLVAVGAFAATRGLAYDAARPLAVIESTSLLSGKTILRVPRVDHCGESLEKAPIIDAGDGLAVNGQRTTPAGLTEVLGGLRRSYMRLHPDASDADSVVVLAPADRRAAELVPILAAVRDAGFAKVQGAVIVPHDVDTRTLGHLTRASDCRRTLALDRPIAPTTGATWADLLVNDSL